MVDGPVGKRQRTEGRKLTTLQMTVDVLLAPVNAACAAEWARVDPEDDDLERLTLDDAAIEKYVDVTIVAAAMRAGELDVIKVDGVTYIVRNTRYEAWQYPGPIIEQSIAYTWDKAVELAAKRPLLRLTLHAASPEAARNALTLALPFGAATLSASAKVGGKVREGGTVNFVVTGVKANHSLKPLETAATLWRSLADGAAYEASVDLDFGGGVVADALAKLQQAQVEAEAGASVGLTAEFGDAS
jgi:hypothetical protein